MLQISIGVYCEVWHHQNDKTFAPFAKSHMHRTQKLVYGTVKNMWYGKCGPQYLAFNCHIRILRAFEESSFSGDIFCMILLHTNIKRMKNARKLFHIFSRTQSSLERQTRGQGGHQTNYVNNSIPRRPSFIAIQSHRHGADMDQNILINIISIMG